MNELFRETIELSRIYRTSFRNKIKVNIPHKTRENCKTVYSNLVLIFSLTNNIQLNLSNTFNQVEYYIDSKLVNLCQQENYLKPMQWGNMIIVPLPVLDERGTTIMTSEEDFNHYFMIDLNPIDHDLYYGAIYLTYTYNSIN